MLWRERASVALYSLYERRLDEVLSDKPHLQFVTCRQPAIESESKKSRLTDDAGQNIVF